MTRQSYQKYERIIEAVRQGLEGDAAIDFVRKNGFALSSAGIARHLRKLGGRGAVQERIDEGKSNAEIVQECHPEADSHSLLGPDASQQELFGADNQGEGDRPPVQRPLYETRKMTLHIPAELYEAIRAAAQGERKSQNQLIVDLLTHALSRQGPPVQSELNDEDDQPEG